MEHVGEIAQMMEEVGGGVAFQSVMIDFADNWGGAFMGVRSFDFWYAGAKIPMVFADGDFIYGSTSMFGAEYLAEFAFDTSLPKDGNWNDTSWLAASGNATNQRIWIRFATPQVITGVRVNNAHHSGNFREYGVKNTVIRGTADTGVPLDAYNGAIPSEVAMWSGVIDEHAATSVEDEQILY